LSGTREPSLVAPNADAVFQTAEHRIRVVTLTDALEL
jgi:hypothetical protein